MKELFLLLPSIRSGFNVGSFFRTADGFGVSKIILTGFTPYPPHAEISKTALGAEDFVNWEFYLDPKDAIAKLKKDNVEIIALENTKNAEDISKFKPKGNKVCLIVGNEIDGISKEILNLADRVVKINMKGKKESFNVSIAGAIAIHEISKKLL